MGPSRLGWVVRRSMPRVSSPTPGAPLGGRVWERWGGAVGDETRATGRGSNLTIEFVLPEPPSSKGRAFNFHALTSPNELRLNSKSDLLHISKLYRGRLPPPGVSCQALPRRGRRRRRVPGGSPLAVNSSMPGFNFANKSVTNSSGKSRACTCSCWQPSILQWPRMKL